MMNQYWAPDCPYCGNKMRWNGFVWHCPCGRNYGPPVPQRIPPTNPLPQMPSIQQPNMERIESLLERIVELLEKRNEK